ncbi:MAG: hypothetical protein ACM3MK_04500 [Chitinophagales bacterium]
MEGKEESTIVVELNDPLMAPDSDAVGNPGFSSESLRILPGLTSKGKQSNPPKTNLTLILQIGLIAAMGSSLAWVIGVLFFLQDSTYFYPFAYVLNVAPLFPAIPGGLIGITLGCLPGLMDRKWSKALTGAALCMLLGVAAGAIAGITAQLAYLLFEAYQIENQTYQVLIKSAAWAWNGLIIGICPGIIAGSGEKMFRGMVGGLLGGIIGGVIINVPFQIYPLHHVNLGVALAVMGFCIGAAYGESRD